MNATTAAGHRPSTRRAPPAASIHGEQIMSEGEAAATGRPLRLLVPVNANDDSRWGITYALRLHAQGRAVEVCCLNVGEPVTQWEVLRFRTQADIARFQAERKSRNIPVITVGRQGMPVPPADGGDITH